MDIVIAMLVGAAVILSGLALLVASTAHQRVEAAWREIERLTLQKRQCICSALEANTSKQCVIH